MSAEEYDPFVGDEDDYEDDVDLNPENKAPSNRLDRFKGEQGKVYRVSLMYFHTLEQSIIQRSKRKAAKEGIKLDKAAVKTVIQKALTQRAEQLKKSVDELEVHEKLDLKRAQFKKHNTQFLKLEEGGGGLFISRLGKDGPEADRYWNQLDDVRTYYYTVILVYPMKRNGKIDMENIIRDGEVMPWRLGSGMFNTLIDKNEMLKNLNAGSSLASTDLTFSCKNTKFQNFDVDPAGESLWIKSDKIRNEFLPQAVQLYDRMVDARAITTAELKEKLGVSGDSGEDVTDDDDDLNALVDNV